MEKVRVSDLTKIRTGKLDANASSEDGKYPFFTCSVQAFSGLAVYAEYEKRETGNVTSAAFHEKSEKKFNLDR